MTETTIISWFDRTKEYEVDDGTSIEIKIVGTSDEPYFRADDICKALRYKHTRLALSKVNPKYKLNLNEITKKLLRGFCNSQNPGFSARYEGQQPYLSEAGVYELAFSSKLPAAIAFKSWVFEDLLPSIRRQGISNLQTTLSAHQKALEDKDAALAATQQALIEKEKELADTEKVLEDTKRCAIQFKNLAIKHKSRACKQYIYISTTKVYSQQHRFKVGGVHAHHLLPRREGNYNSGRSREGDDMYLTAIFKCVNFHHLEARIKDLIGEYREGDGKTEMYNINYTSLYDLIDCIVNHANDETELYNAKLEEIMAAMSDATTVVPEPLLLNGAECRAKTIGGHRCGCKEEEASRIDFDAMSSEEEKDTWLNDTLRIIAKSWVTEGDTANNKIDRKALFKRFDDEYNLKFNKAKIWPRIKPVLIRHGLCPVY